MLHVCDFKIDANDIFNVVKLCISKICSIDVMLIVIIDERNFLITATIMITIFCVFTIRF